MESNTLKEFNKILEDKELVKDIVIVLEYLTKGPGKKIVKEAVSGLSERILKELKSVK